MARFRWVKAKSSGGFGGDRLYPGSFGFPACRKRSVEVDFSGGGGEQQRRGVAVACRRPPPRIERSGGRRPAGSARPRALPPRRTGAWRQRLYGLALGYEDLNDHDELRHDLALQTAFDRVAPLESAPTLCRFEVVIAMHQTPLIRSVTNMSFSAMIMLATSGAVGPSWGRAAR